MIAALLGVLIVLVIILLTREQNNRNNIEANRAATTSNYNWIANIDKARKESLNKKGFFKRLRKKK